MATAVMIVRTLAKNEYAWYSMANNFWMGIALFSGTGAVTGLTAIGGESLNNKQQFDTVIVAAYKLRLSLFLGSMFLALPMLGYLLNKNGCPPVQNALLLAMCAALVFLETSSQTAATILSLRRAYNLPQMAESFGGILRPCLFMVLLLAGCFTPSSILFITAVSMALSLAVITLPKLELPTFSLTLPPSPALRKRFINHTLNGLPGSLTVLFQGQIGMLLLAWSGKVEGVANLGALGRVGLLIAIPMAVTGKILIPLMAGETQRRRLINIWMIGVLYGAILGAALMLSTICFSDQMFWLLGSQYAGLKRELLLYTGAMAFSTVSFQVCAISLARGWLKHSWLRPVVVLISQCIVISFMNVSTLEGAITLIYASTIANLLFDILLAYRGLRGLGGL